MLQEAVATDSFQMFTPLQRGGAQACRRSRCATCWTSAPRAATPIAVDEVESITEIRKRLVAPGISLGALSPEAHETLSIAMNRIGARSDSGEGGEDPARAKPRANGDNANSAIKQIASGPVRRHRGIPERLPRDRDQGGAGRQARRGRPAARLQGHRS